MANGYIYDIFLSYKYDELIIPWIEEVEKRLKYWITQELGGREAKIFFDKKNIEAGDRWTDTLKNGLKSSRCFIGIWTPEYFHSKWCVSEWKTFEARQNSAKDKECKLILPIRFHDGEHFPAEALEFQLYDLRNYTSTLRVFWDTPKAAELDEKLKIFSSIVAKAINSSPDYDSNFPIIEANAFQIDEFIKLQRF